MILAHAVPPFATRDLSGCTDKEDRLVAKVGTSKKKKRGSTISLLAAVRMEHMLQAQLKRRRMELTASCFRIKEWVWRMSVVPLKDQ